MEKTMNLFYLVLILLLSGCDMFNTDKKEPEPEVEQYFQAEVNGESWSGESLLAAFTLTETETVLQVFAIQYDDEANFPYNNHIGFTLDYNPDKVSYDVIWKLENTWIYGDAYYEKDGDARIALYINQFRQILII